MNIQDLLDKATAAIVNFKFEEVFKGSKFVALIFVVIFMALVLFGLLFSLIPQF